VIRLVHVQQLSARDDTSIMIGVLKAYVLD